MTNKATAATMCLAIVLAGFGDAANSQVSPTPDCAEPLYQAAINMCARAEHEVADKEMSAVFDQLIAQLRDQDRSYADLGPEYVGAEMLMAASQKSWAGNRSDACAARGVANYGGSMRPAVIASCFAMMARSRTEELRWLLD